MVTAAAVSVIVSMLSLVPGCMGGSETYARELLRSLGASGLDVSTLVSPLAEGFSEGLRELVAPEYATGCTPLARVRGHLFGLARSRSLTGRTAGAAVIHYPFTVPVPSRSADQRQVVSLHDVQHRDLPSLFSRAERIYRALAYDRAARRADAVITFSEFSKRRIVEQLGIEPIRVHVASLGVRPEDFTASTDIRQDFILYPARAWAHKNHGTLFDAFRLLRGEHPALRLVLTGASMRDLPPLPEGVEARGQVSKSELVALYRQAAALVFPSRYEGFGLPVLEAMSSGCPVAAARAGSLPEVVADAGVLFDPKDPADVARGVLAAIERSTDLRHLGVKRAREFTWEACAAVHVRVYRELGA